MHRLLAATLLLAVLAAPARGEQPPVLQGDVRGHGDCAQFVPSVPAPTTGRTLDLVVLVLAEGKDMPAVRDIAAVASQTYARLGIRLVPRYRVSRPVPDLDADADRYMEWLKGQLRGTRPPGIDVVYLATGRTIGSAGLADCIGGIAHPEHAFALGMLAFDGAVGVNVQPDPGVPQPALAEGGGKLMAHEIGHLLGAHHHYGATCAAPAGADDPRHPCDVMFTVPQALLGKHFGPVNAAVVRDHAQRFA